VRDFPERTPDRGPMILYRITLAVAVAVCLVLAVSASAKEPRSAPLTRGPTDPSNRTAEQRLPWFH
jgi:hypothetical protein